jgi:Clp amino terminal domain, pathogenicity island component
MMRPTGWRESPMFERFTDGARRVVVLAQHEARHLNHNYIGTEHLLLGLLADGASGDEDVAAAALDSLGISLEMIRHDVEEIIGKGITTPGDHIPFTPRAKKVLELSLREALQLGHNYIGTEHILLGLVREGEGVAAQVLVKHGAGLNSVRERVIELLVQRPGRDQPEGEPGPGAATMRVHRTVVAPPMLGRMLSQPPELARVVPIGRQVEIGEGLRLVLLSLEIWSGWLDLRLATVCSAPGRSASQLLASYSDWQLSDDLDTDYRQVGTSSSGDDQLHLGQVSFQPSPPPEAKRLTLTVAGEAEEQLRVEIELS